MVGKQTRTTKNNASKSTRSSSESATKGSDAVSLLKADHRAVEALFKKYEQATEDSSKSPILSEVCTDLAIHTILEEEIFYPACRDSGVETEAVNEAQVEHDAVKILIADLLGGDDDPDMRDAKVKVLSEYVKHHVAEEEKANSGIFAEARKAGVDMQDLGERLAERKEQLQQRAEGRRLTPPLKALQVEASLSRQHQYGETMQGSSYRARGEQGRFAEDDESRGYRSGGSGPQDYRPRQGNWQGQPQRSRFAEDDDRGYRDAAGQSQARGYDQRDYAGRSGGRGDSYQDDHDLYERSSRQRPSSRGYDENYGRSPGWNEGSESYSQSPRRGWEDRESRWQARQHEDDRDDYSEGRGWHGDPQGHAEAARRGWEERGSYRDQGEDDEREGGRQRQESGWYGDPEGHSAASRRGWRNR